LVAQVFDRPFDDQLLSSDSRAMSYRLDQVPSVVTPTYSNASLIKLYENEVTKFVRFGHEHLVDIDFMKSSLRFENENGTITRLLKIKSEGAKSINLIFSKFQLPEESKMYIYDSKKSRLQGPIIHDVKNKIGGYANDVLPGEEIVIQLQLSNKTAEDEAQISISTIVHAFRDFTNGNRVTSTSLGCHNDMMCHPQYENESNAVAAMIEGGFAKGSGALINNVRQDRIPYFLTTSHVVVEIALPNYVFRFKYKKAACGGTQDGPTTYSVTGANTLSNAIGEDIQLIQLSNDPSSSIPNLTYLGWDISSAVPSSLISLHHPWGDNMKISFGQGIDRYVKTNGDDTWRLKHTSGLWETWSSGGPVIDENKRLRGIVSGGEEVLNCTNFNSIYAFSARLENA